MTNSFSFSKAVSNFIEVIRMSIIVIGYVAVNIACLGGAGYLYFKVFPNFQPIHEASIEIPTFSWVLMLIIGTGMFIISPIIASYHSMKDGYRWSENGCQFTDVLCISLSVVGMTIGSMVISMTFAALFGVNISHLWLNLLLLSLMSIYSLIVIKAHANGRKSFKHYC